MIALQPLKSRVKADFSWLTHERRNWIAAVVLGMVTGYAAANGHATYEVKSKLTAQVGQKEAQLKTAQKAEKCQERRANTLALVASGDTDQSEVPYCPVK